jgi:amidophosphoribosyltransferase
MRDELSLSYSLLVMTYDRIYAVRDPYGNRPLCIGTIETNATNGLLFKLC